MKEGHNNEFMLGDWHVTPLRGVVQGPLGSRRITPRAMDVLLCLVRHSGDVVSRDTFYHEVWPGAYSDDPLNKCIAELRRQLGDTASSRAYIETIPKRGYRLVATVETIGSLPHEPRRTGLSSRLRTIALAVLVALAVFGAFRLTSEYSAQREVSVAVLPFTSRDNPDHIYLADGMQEDLIRELSRSDSLTVRSRTSTLQYRDRTQTLPEIASTLGVDVIVEGSVRQEGDTVRVSAQLVQGEKDVNLWAGSIEKSRSVESLFTIPEELAIEIANALDVSPGDATADAPGIPTTSAEAYDAFMLGKFHYRRKLPGDILKSVRQFEHAVTLDPRFVDAWDWLAFAYNHAATAVGYLSPDEAYPKARAAALRALEIEPNLATARSILGYIRAVYDRDWVGAIADLERAVELDPNDSGTVWSLAHVYAMLGEHDKSIVLTTTLADRAPHIGRRHVEAANRLIDAGRYNDALQRLDMATANDAEPADVAAALGVTHLALGQLESAAAQLEYAVEGKQRAVSTIAQLAYAYARLGRTADADALVDELNDRSSTERISRVVFAIVEAGFGNLDGALLELKRAAVNGDRETLELRSTPFFTELHPDAMFQTLVDDVLQPR